MEATKKRKINTKQLTAVKSTRNNGKRVFYFRYYCPDLQKDNVRRFANTEAEAKVLREKVKEKREQLRLALNHQTAILIMKLFSGFVSCGWPSITRLLYLA